MSIIHPVLLRSPRPTHERCIRFGLCEHLKSAAAGILKASICSSDNLPSASDYRRAWSGRAGRRTGAQKRRRRRSRGGIRVVPGSEEGGETSAGGGKHQAPKRGIKQAIKQSDAAARRSGPSHRVKPEKARERLREQLAASGQSVTQQLLRKRGQRAAGINDDGIVFAYCGRRRHRRRARLCDGN